MSLITCCPACQTMFQVSGEDLRVSDGWVRCGKCNGVFDASAHLQVMPPAQEESVAPPFALEPEALVPQPTERNAPSWPSQALPPNPPASFPAADRPSLFRAATPGVGMASDTAFSDFDNEPDPRDPILADAPVPAMPATRAEPSTATLRREDMSARPSFTPEPIRFSDSKQRSGVRLVFWLLALTVAGAALLGWARHERQALVQRMPALLPAMDSLCRLSACEVKAPRVLDMITIEDASMQETAPSEYKIQLMLKNVGQGAVELPSLKVTLTGLQGEVLASHEASPSEFAAGLTRLASYAPLSVAFSFSAASVPAASPAAVLALVPASSATPVLASAPAEPSAVPEAVQVPAALPISGYRVIAFYP